MSGCGQASGPSTTDAGRGFPMAVGIGSIGVGGVGVAAAMGSSSAEAPKAVMSAVPSTRAAAQADRLLFIISSPKDQARAQKRPRAMREGHSLPSHPPCPCFGF